MFTIAAQGRAKNKWNGRTECVSQPARYENKLTPPAVLLAAESLSDVGCKVTMKKQLTFQIW